MTGVLRKRWIIANLPRRARCPARHSQCQALGPLSRLFGGGKGVNRSFPDVPFDQTASTAASRTWGLCPRARRVQGRSLPRSQGRLCSSAPLRGAPAGQPLNAPLMRAGLSAPRSRARCMASIQSKGHPMSKTTNPPSHRVYAVTKNGKRSYWRPIGAAGSTATAGLQPEARLPPAQRRRDRHPQAEGRRGRLRDRRLTSGPPQRAAPF